MDVTKEALLSLTDAAALVGKHVATLYRWSTSGYRGVVLETIQVGATRCTTHDALQRFCERVTGETRLKDVRPAAGTSGAQAAAEELERYGV